MDIAGQLKELHQLHQSGALTDEEFAQAKQAVLAGKVVESKTVDPGRAGGSPDVVKGKGVLAEVVPAPAAGPGGPAAIPTSVPYPDPTAVPNAAPAETPLSETVSCKVRTGWSLRHSTDLIIGPDRIRLGDRELLATEVEWIRCEEETITNRGRTTITEWLELGNSTTSLKFNLCDSVFSKGNTAVFPQILSIVYQSYGPRILQKLIDTLAGGSSFNIGKLRFTPIGVEIPKKKYLILSDKPVAVPWARVRCGSPPGQSASRAAIRKILTGVGWRRAGGVFVFDSATEHQLSTVGSVVGTDSGYSTSHEEGPWTPNVSLVAPLVQFMVGHPEISGGPWYVAREKQKVGPLAWSQLLKMASGGMLQPADMLLQEGAEKPLAAATIPGLFSGE
jgi:hypothetical protein